MQINHCAFHIDTPRGFARWHFHFAFGRALIFLVFSLSTSWGQAK